VFGVHTRVALERGIYPAGTRPLQIGAWKSQVPFAFQLSCGLKHISFRAKNGRREVTGQSDWIRHAIKVQFPAEAKTGQTMVRLSPN
jgi:hypothetical protein